ncbi:hypothetical protein QFC21_007273 [Naganishia friedmannii]|uniref:Uncharacterized protein n=1 Tax=Naganishia friedmannii TaxID=89922 RepID=A0ACC2UW23_9TREE|nr:hypothetical protein QFC21_007273 [Naganishia friedmannii]
MSTSALQRQSVSQKRTMAVENPTGMQILQWISHIAGYRIFKMSAGKQHRHSQQTSSSGKQLVLLSVRDWDTLCIAAQFSNSLALFLPLDESVPLLEQQLGYRMDVVKPLNTGIPAVGQKAVFFRYNTTRLVLAFEATKPKEMIMNAWSHGKDKKWNSVPYARYRDGRQVHSFYLDMWLGMRKATLEALTDNILEVEHSDQVPSSFIVSGHSMGGGISTLAIIDIIEHLRTSFGSLSTQPRPWALDEKLGSFIRHITFAEFAASGQAYNEHLNEYYARYAILGIDLVHPFDFTTRLHLPFFRAWRGHRYVLPSASVKPFEKEYAAGRHDMPGYLRSVEWLRDNPRELVSLYDYGR